jgi:AraC-like DNA-binding protein
MSVRTGPTRSGPRWWLVTPTLLATQVLVMLEGTVVNVSLVRIRAEYGLDDTALSWVLVSYLLAFVMTQLLHVGNHRYLDELTAPADPVRRGRLGPVLDYMEQHADEPITPQELARVGCMSVRTLHATFQQELSESPMGHLRRIRLDHVRAELLRCDAASTRVTDVALRWGFFHQSRFAQQYKERFGELPRETLRER